MSRDGSEVFRIERLRYLEGKPLVLHEACLPAALGAKVSKLDLEYAAMSAPIPC